MENFLKKKLIAVLILISVGFLAGVSWQNYLNQIPEQQLASLETTNPQQISTEDNNDFLKETTHKETKPLIKIVEKYIPVNKPTQEPNNPEPQTTTQSTTTIEESTGISEIDKLIAFLNAQKEAEKEAQAIAELKKEKEQIIAELEARKWIQYYIGKDSFGRSGYTIITTENGVVSTTFFASNESEIEILRKILNFVWDKEDEWQKRTKAIISADVEKQRLEEVCKAQGGRYNEDYQNSCQLGSKSCHANDSTRQWVRQIWDGQRWTCPSFCSGCPQP